MGLTGTKAQKLSKKSIQARKEIPTFLGLIGRTFEFGTDNIGQNEPRLRQSRPQRRRASRKNRKTVNRYAFCEFGTKIPVNSRRDFVVVTKFNTKINLHKSLQFIYFEVPSFTKPLCFLHNNRNSSNSLRLLST